MSKKYLLTYKTKPDDLPRARLHFATHRQRLDMFREQGTLLMVGTIGSPPTSALGIFTTREAAEAFMKDDPFILHGVVESPTIQEWDEIYT